MLFPFLFLSPWYNCNGWLGVKHQITYFYFCCLSLVEVMKKKKSLGGGGGGGGPHSELTDFESLTFLLKVLYV